ncbi:hypothetical protein BGP_6413 [Beggiatoa sp. PS]|nr:hypothetical protein BGP_6413 [Beggiatoa sp. PS]
MTFFALEMLQRIEYKKIAWHPKIWWYSKNNEKKF